MYISTVERRQAVGIKSMGKLIVLRQFEYRKELNISKDSRFPIPYHI